jgi:hypothetical protein
MPMCAWLTGVSQFQTPRNIKEAFGRTRIASLLKLKTIAQMFTLVVIWRTTPGDQTLLRHVRHLFVTW